MGDPNGVAAEPYRQAQEGALIAPVPGAGLLRLVGPDRVDFLHRLSTNDLTGLHAGNHTDTLLTNALGRMVDWLTVLCLPEELLLVTSAGRAEPVRAWLADYIFFGDDVEVLDASEEWPLWGLYGPGAGEAARELLGGGVANESNLSISSEWIAWRTDRPRPGRRLLARGAAAEAASEHWGEGPPIEARAAAFDVLRIEAGVPQFGAEISAEVTPLEVNLGGFVDFEKGCYIGQEVIARMESRGRAPRALRGLQLDGRAEPGSELHAAGQRVGELTSWGHSPAQGPIGLGLFQTRNMPPEDAPLETGDGVQGSLRPLPWPP